MCVERGGSEERGGRLLITVTVSCPKYWDNVPNIGTNLGGPVGGCCGGQNEPARPVQSASHDGTDPPKLTFEARLSTLTLKVVPSGRLSRPRFREAVSAPKWPNSRVARSAADPSGLGAGDGRDTERLRTGCELLCRGAPRCRYRRHWPGSNSRRGMSLR